VSDETSVRTRAGSLLAVAAGAAALGAFAIGALAIGRLAIGRAAIGTLRIGRLEIDETSSARDRAQRAAEHPNLDIVRRAAALLTDSARDSDHAVIGANFVWHCFNPQLPELAGDYRGLEGARELFAMLSAVSGGAFSVKPTSLSASGDELVITHAKVALKLGGAKRELDSVVVWRVVAGQVTEAWDIPAVNSVRGVT